MKKILSLCLCLCGLFLWSTFALEDVSWSASDYTEWATATYTFHFTNEFSERDPSLKITLPEGFEYVWSDLSADISVSMSGWAFFTPASIDPSLPLFNAIALYADGDTLVPASTPFTVTIANILNPQAGTYERPFDLEFFWEWSEFATLSDIEIVSARNGCANYSGANFLWSVVLNPDGTVIGCDSLDNVPADLIPGWTGWENYFDNQWSDFSPRLWWACDDCFIWADGVYGQNPLPLGFDINYYGRTYSGVYVGSNGSVTFDEWSSNYDAPLEDILWNGPGICIYCIDLENWRQLNNDTYVRGSGRHIDMFYRWRTTIDGRPAFAATWINMAQFRSVNSPLNTFQILFVDVSDANDDVDIILNYGSITNGNNNQWYCDYWDEEESNCNLVAIWLGSFTSEDELIYNSLLNDNGIALNGRSIMDLADDGQYALASNRLNSNVDGMYRFAMVGGSLPGSIWWPEEEELVEPVHSGWGWGGWLTVDYCPEGDNSWSYYDGKCDGGVTGASNQVSSSTVDLPKFIINQIEKKSSLEFCKYNDTQWVSAAFADIVWTPYASAVWVLVSHCLVQGYSNNGQEFGINNPLKRGELYKVFTRMALLDFDLNHPWLGWSHGYKIAGENAGLWNLLNMSKDQEASVPQQELLQVAMNYLAYMGVLDEAPEFAFGSKQVTRGEFARFIDVVLGLVSTK